MCFISSYVTLEHFWKLQEILFTSIAEFHTLNYKILCIQRSESFVHIAYRSFHIVKFIHEKSSADFPYYRFDISEFFITENFCMASPVGMIIALNLWNV